MKPIPPLSREEKAKRRLAKKNVDNDAKLEAKGPPESGVSIGGSIHLPVVITEWKFKPGIGWYHDDDAFYVMEFYRLCEVTQRYYLRALMVQTHDRGGYINKNHIPPTMAMDLGTLRLYPKDELFEVRDEKNEVAYGQTKFRDHHYMMCQCLGTYHQTALVFRYTRPHTPSWKCVSKVFIRMNPDLFTSCPCCGNVTERAGIVKRDDGDNQCPDCWHKHKTANLIHKHDYIGYPRIISSNPKLKLMVDGRLKSVSDESHRLFGVECEVEITDDSEFDRYQLASNILDVLGEDFVVMKNDGSLNEHNRDSPFWGFEIVSAPADFEVHKRKWAELEKAKGFNYLRAWQTITCGMHVHVGKSSLTTLQIGRILVFINAKENKKFIETVAGRNSKAASRFLEDKRLGDGMRPDPDKYCAVNIRPEHTIEFRIFRGTIRYKHIIRNIEFCDAVCTYCHPAARSLADMRSYRSFIAFCKDNRKLYPTLCHWMENYKYIPARKLPPGVTIEEVVEAMPVTMQSQGKWY